MTNLTGKRFGKLIALDYVGNYKWMCICDCGNRKKIRSDNLIMERIRSCGCLHKECARALQYKHGDYKTKLYGIWAGMKSRCTHVKHKGFKYYGGRGIRVCDEWRGNYSTFKSWAILNGYQNGLTIDRIDNDGNYEPSNCQWLTRLENTIKGNLKRNEKIN